MCLVDQRTWPQTPLSHCATLPLRSRPRKDLERAEKEEWWTCSLGAGSSTSLSRTNRVDVDMLLFCVLCVCVFEQLKARLGGWELRGQSGLQSSAVEL